MLEPAHLDRDFDYLVPPEMDEIAQPGVRVRIRFSGRLIDGFLLERLEKSDHTGKLMRLERVVSPERVLTPEILRLVTAVAARYAGTRADVLRLAIPPRHAKTEAAGVQSKSAAVKSSGAIVDLDSADVASEGLGRTDVSGSAAPAGRWTDTPGRSAASGAASGVVETPIDPIAAESGSKAAQGDSAVGGGSIESIDADESEAAAVLRRTNATVPGTQVESVSAASDDSPAGLESESGPSAPQHRTNTEAAEAQAESASAPDAALAAVSGSDAVPGDSAGDAGPVELSGVGETSPVAPIAAGRGRAAELRADAGAEATYSAGDTLGSDPLAGSAEEASARGSVADANGMGPAVDEDDSARGRQEGAERVSGSAVLERFPGWGRYRHGGSFLGALAQGAGPRAGWQALPGEDWARRLAELAAVVVDSGRGAVIMVPDQRDLDRVLAACVELVGRRRSGWRRGWGRRPGIGGGWRRCGERRESWSARVARCSRRCVTWV